MLSRCYSLSLGMGIRTTRRIRITSSPPSFPVSTRFTSSLSRPPTLRGAVSSKASGSFKANLNKGEDVIDYELSYEGLEGTVTQAHIHFGQRHTVGGIVIWLCQTTGTPAPTSPPEVAATPICPSEGTVKGTIAAAQVLAQTAQGIAAGEFDEILRAIRGWRRLRQRSLDATHTR